MILNDELITASSKLTRKKAPIKTIGRKRMKAKSVKLIWNWIMMSDHPSKVMHWNTTSNANIRLSKFVTPKFGF